MPVRDDHMQREDVREASPDHLEVVELASLYDRIAHILAIGFWTSITIIVLGVVLGIVQDGELGEEALDIVDVVPAVLDLEAEGVIALGLLILLLTPLAYVVVALVTFLYQRDRLFVGICSLLVLLFAVTIGVALL